MSAPITWTTQDKRVMRVSKMELSHMRNVVHMVCRSRRVSLMILKDALSATSYATTAPDGAAMAAEEAAGELIDAAYDRKAIEARLAYATKISPPVAFMVRRLRRAKFDFLSVPDTH